MHAMMLKRIRAPLEWTELADRVPGPGQIRVKIAACGVCRTDLHVVDGELPDPRVPKDAPPYDATAPLERGQEVDLFEYYGRPAYWQKDGKREGI